MFRMLSGPAHICNTNSNYREKFPGIDNPLHVADGQFITKIYIFSQVKFLNTEWRNKANLDIFPKLN